MRWKYVKGISADFKIEVLHKNYADQGVCSPAGVAIGPASTPLTKPRALEKELSVGWKDADDTTKG